MLRAYCTEIYLTKAQRIQVHKTMGVSKFVKNLYLKVEKDEYEKTGKFYSGMDFSKWLNNEFIPDNPEYSWIKEVSSKSVKQAIMNTERAFRKFFKGEAEYPKPKKRKDSVKMYFVKNNTADCTIERHRFKVPTLGFVRLKEYGYIPLDAKVKSGTIGRRADRYFMSVLCEVDEVQSDNVPTKEGIGVDLGLTDLAIVSNGEKFANINKTNKVKKMEKRRKRQQRKLSKKIKKIKKGEANKSNVQKNKLKVQRLYMKLANIRQEYARHVVNSLVAMNPKFIAIEDLNVQGMKKNKHLSKAISEALWGYFKLFLIQQCRKHNIEVRIIPRYYASSQLCSTKGCTYKNPKTKNLNVREWVCPECSTIHNRDINAAINIRDCEIYSVA
ncbi:MAG: transposase [Oscillospiraceae bacterium]|nr:transposase [Oscillospiraceae bacterium]